MSEIFLYPCNPFNKEQVDALYAQEVDCVKKLHCALHYIDVTAIETSVIIPPSKEDRYVIYRGHPLSADTYGALEQRFGKRLVISKDEYLRMHYFSGWYDEIASLTIPSIITNEQSVFADFKSFGSSAYMQDYTKSGFVVASEHDVQQALVAMRQLPGSIEGGIVLRKVIEFVPGSQLRFFVANNRLFCPTRVVNKHVYALAEEVVLRFVQKNMTFYSIDIAMSKEGVLYVVKLDDGQVSDCIGWNIERFARVLDFLKYNWMYVGSPYPTYPAKTSL